MPPAEKGRGSEELLRFCKRLDAEPDLAQRVKTCTTPEEITEIALSICCAVDEIDLRAWSKELSARYFPWAGKGRKWRLDFFTGPPIDQVSECPFNIKGKGEKAVTPNGIILPSASR
jgi:hypothetical protein